MVVTMKFDENLERLDEILNQLEEGKLPLDDALSIFEQGVTLVRESRKFLEEAEQKVTLLTQDNGEVPFVHTQAHV
ncbi:MAG: exodeoxyribonuclease VII small subunit [Synergistaceae bacterium]|jgi:exodeoxyribonuclease VII small subunit|nr:exodeoxyribonuclease VII small subunit [Synergistaceae bacterium]